MAASTSAAAVSTRRVNSRKSFGTAFTPGSRGGGDVSVEDADFAAPSTGAAMSSSALSSMYTSVLKLSAENKITAKNSWSIPLIDHMSRIISEDGDRENRPPAVSSTSAGGKAPALGAPLSRTEQHAADAAFTNFAKASCALDASVRIWSCRVDDVYSSSFRVLENLSRSDAPTAASSSDAPEEEEDDAGEDAPTGAKRAPKAKKAASASLGEDGPINVGAATLESNPSAITLEHIEAACEVDPVFHKLSSSFDEAGVSGMLLNRLRVMEHGAVAFDASVCGDSDATADALPGATVHALLQAWKSGTPAAAPRVTAPAPQLAHMRAALAAMTSATAASRVPSLAALYDTTAAMCASLRLSIPIDTSAGIPVQLSARPEPDAVAEVAPVIISTVAAPDVDDCDVGDFGVYGEGYGEGDADVGDSAGTSGNVGLPAVDAWSAVVGDAVPQAGAKHWMFHDTMAAAQKAAEEREAARERVAEHDRALEAVEEAGEPDAPLPEVVAPKPRKARKKRAAAGTRETRGRTKRAASGDGPRPRTRASTRASTKAAAAPVEAPAPAPAAVVDDEPDADGFAGYSFDDAGGGYDAAPQPQQPALPVASLPAPVDGAVQLVTAARHVERIRVRYETVSKRVDVAALKSDMRTALAAPSLAAHIPNVSHAQVEAEYAGRAATGAISDGLVLDARAAPGAEDATFVSLLQRMVAGSPDASSVTVPFYFITLLHIANERGLAFAPPGNDARNISDFSLYTSTL